MRRICLGEQHLQGGGSAASISMISSDRTGDFQKSGRMLSAHRIIQQFDDSVKEQFRDKTREHYQLLLKMSMYIFMK